MRSSAERDIDVLFAGNIKAADPFEKWLNITFPNSPEIEHVLLEAKDNLVSARAHPFTVTVEALQAADVEFTPETLAEIYGPLNHYLINSGRARVLGAIRRHAVTVIGDVDTGVTPMTLPTRSSGCSRSPRS